MAEKKGPGRPSKGESTKNLRAFGDDVHRIQQLAHHAGTDTADFIRMHFGETLMTMHRVMVAEMYAKIQEHTELEKAEKPKKVK